MIRRFAWRQYFCAKVQSGNPEPHLAILGDKWQLGGLRGVTLDALSPRDIFEAPPGGKKVRMGFRGFRGTTSVQSRTGLGVGAPSPRASRRRPFRPSEATPGPRGRPLGSRSCQTEHPTADLTFLHQPAIFRGIKWRSFRGSPRVRSGNPERKIGSGPTSPPSGDTSGHGPSMFVVYGSQEDPHL